MTVGEPVVRGLEELPYAMTMEQVARFLQISRAKAYELYRRGEPKLPVRWIGKNVRVLKSDLVAWLNALPGNVNFVDIGELQESIRRGME